MSKSLKHKRSWVEIDILQLIHNYKKYKSHCSEKPRIIAVVKANAYGHGDVMVAKCLQKEGVTCFAVSNIDEAISLRTAGIKGEILILGYTPISALSLLKRYDITQTLISEEYAELFFENGGADVKCQFAINTGMNRLGLNCRDLDACEKIIRQYAKKLCLNGIFTHLCVADSMTEDDVEFTHKQTKSFDSLADRLEDLNLEYVHCRNSAGGLTAESKYNNIVRLGIVLYGLKPSEDVSLPVGIEPVLSWKSIISRIDTVEKNESIGYGRTYVAERKMRIATIPTGYADGYSRLLSNRGYVLIRGQKAPIVGRICMDQMTVDVTDINGVCFEDEVVIIGKSENEILTADSIAAMIDTIGYEIICSISPRVERIYL